MDQPNANNFSFDDVELEIAHGKTLGHRGPESNARATGSIGTIDYVGASVGGIFDDIVYGKDGQQQLCLVKVTITFTSTYVYRLTSSDIVLRIGSLETDKIKATSDDIKRPRILKRDPTRLSDRNPTSVQVTREGIFNPQIAVGQNISIAVGSLGRREEFTRTSGWDFKSAITKTHFEQDTLTFNATANEYEREGLAKEFTVEVTLEHTGGPFYIDFGLFAKMSFSTIVRHPRRILGRGGSLTSRRHFSPPAL